jgi:membrane protein implicated in regulation of membrane protease activity
VRLLPRPPVDATPHEAHALDVSVTALSVGGVAALVCALLGSTPGALAGLTVAAAGWVALGVVLWRAVRRRERAAAAELEQRRAALLARHEERRDELAELRRSLGLSPREEDGS